MENTYQLINPATIASNMMNNKDMIKQFIGLYLNQLPIDFSILTEAINSQEHQAIQNQAHHIKPTMQYVGAVALKDKFQTLENAGKNHSNLTCISDLYQDIAKDFDQLIEELQVYNKNL